MSSPKVPGNVLNKTLYASIKKRMQNEHKKKGKRWGAYSSGQLVQEYKRKGGKYSSTHSKSKVVKKSQGKLARWYKEKWIDVCEYNKGKIRSCGRNKFSRSKFPYCRPLHKINSSTPKTVKELSLSQRKSLCKKKRRNPTKIIRRKRSKKSKRKT